MRISDWSSDVCSSDLAERLLARDADAAIRSVEQALVRFDHARGERPSVDRGAVVHAGDPDHAVFGPLHRSEEHTSELQSLLRLSDTVFCLIKKRLTNTHPTCYWYKKINIKQTK